MRASGKAESLPVGSHEDPVANHDLSADDRPRDEPEPARAAGSLESAERLELDSSASGHLYHSTCAITPAFARVQAYRAGNRRTLHDRMRTGSSLADA